MQEVIPTTSIKAITRSIRYYACGGTGINLLRSHREAAVLQNELSVAHEHFSFIDTSLANLENVDTRETFTLKGVDGSGGDRRKNAEAMQKLLPQIMLDHEPTDMNVVIFSSAGGTGSVAGPLLLEELLSQGKSVIAIIIGAHTTLKRTTNTIGTLTGLEQAAERQGRPIVMYYYENDLSKSDADNNLKPSFVLGSLGTLCSGRNKSLDSSDINNALDYPVVTHHAPGLAMLNVHTKGEDVGEGVISYIALLKDEEQVPARITADYDKTGYLPQGTNTQNNYYYTVAVAPLSDLFDELNKKKANIAIQRKNGQSATRLSDGNTKTHTTGLVFD